MVITNTKRAGYWRKRRRTYNNIFLCITFSPSRSLLSGDACRMLSSEILQYH